MAPAGAAEGPAACAAPAGSREALATAAALPLDTMKMRRLTLALFCELTSDLSILSPCCLSKHINSASEVPADNLNEFNNLTKLPFGNVRIA